MTGSGAHLTLVENDELREPTGREIMAEGCRMLAEWLSARAVALPPGEALVVGALIVKLAAIAGS